MITIVTDKINSFTQTSYNKFLDTINLYQLSCSCGFSGCLIKHGFYTRSIKTPGGLLSLSILRVKCKYCGKTHAIFPEIIVPYSQILLDDHMGIITAYIDKASFEPIMMANESIDESNIRYIIRNYLRHWKERIAAFGLTITGDSAMLSKQCIHTFKRQFMQIKCTLNILFS